MEVFFKRACFCLLVYFKCFNGHNIEAALLDTFVLKEILNYEKCPNVNGASVNISHSQDYESITVCWQFMTTAYPICDVQTDNLIYMDRGTGTGELLEFRMYPPISGMSEDGKNVGWLGFPFNETFEGSGNQVPCRSILFNEPLVIYEWQNTCVSFSKKTKKLFLFLLITYLNFISIVHL